jgi:hypothetical protein
MHQGLQSFLLKDMEKSKYLCKTVMHALLDFSQFQKFNIKENLVDNVGAAYDLQ